MAAFYYEHGIEFDFTTYDQFSLLLDVENERLSEDPLRIRLTIPLEGDELSLTFDDQMDVVSIERTGSTSAALSTRVSQTYYLDVH